MERVYIRALLCLQRADCLFGAEQGARAAQEGVTVRCLREGYLE
jgi:hypothetical protein